MSADVITIYIAIPVAVAIAVLTLFGYRVRKKAAQRRQERIERRWPREPFV